MRLVITNYNLTLKRVIVSNFFQVWRREKLTYKSLKAYSRMKLTVLFYVISTRSFEKFVYIVRKISTLAHCPNQKILGEEQFQREFFFFKSFLSSLVSRNDSTLEYNG
jgi:hypothetical protein